MSLDPWRRILSWSGIKLLVARIMLTRFTALYFYVALLTCFMLVTLQGVSFADNAQAVNALSDILSAVNVTEGFPIFANGVLKVCDSIPGQPHPKCTIVAEDPLRSSVDTSEEDSSTWEWSDENEDENDEVEATVAGLATIVLDIPCAKTLSWLQCLLRDSKREDVLTIFFYMWSFVLAAVAVLSESLPHLGAALISHILGTAWAGYRMHSTDSLRTNFRGLLSSGVCDGVDPLGNWWDARRDHAIPIMVISILAFVVMVYVSINLYKLYKSQSFSRVGAPPAIYRIYKLVLFFSAALQVAGFFSIASSALWIDKVSNGNIRSVAVHIHIYQAAVIVTLLLETPWLVLGWILVRRECRWKFIAFSVLSFLLLSIFTAMFTSPLYRYIFSTWPLFATITITAYVFLVITSILAPLCRMQFGRGLAEFIRVNEALEDANFTPVYFPTSKERSGSTSAERDPEKRASDLIGAFPSSQLEAHSHNASNKARSESIYSKYSAAPIKVSTTPPLLRDQMLNNAEEDDARPRSVKHLVSLPSRPRPFRAPGIERVRK